MKCPNRNCIEGDVPEPIRETEHLSLICPDCQKRFCPSPLCGHRELDEDLHCRECNRSYAEEHHEAGGDSEMLAAGRRVPAADEGDLHDFMNAFLNRSR